MRWPRLPLGTVMLMGAIGALAPLRNGAPEDPLLKRTLGHGP
jgi:hypothetical protein